MNDQYVFYLDDNILLDQYDTGDGDYSHEILVGLKIQCAYYYALAAVTIKGRVINHMCVFYQAPTCDGTVKMVSFAGRHRTWELSPANLRDPPLHGTSLTAVPPRAGILGRGKVDPRNEGQPVYYLQLDNNAVGSGQVIAGMDIISLSFSSLLTSIPQNRCHCDATIVTTSRSHSHRTQALLRSITDTSRISSTNHTPTK